MASSGSPRQGKLILHLSALVFFIIGLVTLILGIDLLRLGGTPYFVITGMAIIATAWLLYKRSYRALQLFTVILIVSTIWAIYEVKFDWWQLLPRLDIWFMMGVWLLMPFVRKHLNAPKRLSGLREMAVGLSVTALAGVISLFVDPYSINGTLERSDAGVVNPEPAINSGDWVDYGRTGFGQRYSPLNQITPQNIGKLQVAWQIRTGDMPGKDDPDQTTYEDTPLKVGDLLYVCTPHSRVMAVNATTGKTQWEFDPHVVSPTGSFKGWAHMTCRGVSYHDDAAYSQSTATSSSSLSTTPSDMSVSAVCPRRIFLPTADARLIALNADNGKLCSDFGDNGSIDLLSAELNGERVPGGYYSTSPAAITKDLVIIGGHVTDNNSTYEPSGVIRAFNVHDGHLVWNWDSGNPDVTTPLKPGQKYVNNSPNMWSVMSVDEKAGLIYLPMGNQTPDEWGAKRTPASEKYSAGIVALRIDTGNVAWNYQFTHHDIWDMDVGGQPTLTDIKTPKGVEPALIASTKQGSLYVLNRITGQPIVPINEIPRPASTLPDDHAAPTQPLSDLNFMPKPLTEASMWGTTPFDMLTCRIKFKSLRYDGPFTPPSEQGSIVYPGNFGVFDWGGISVDPVRQIALVNPDHMAFYDTMIPRDKVPTGAKATSETSGIQPNTGQPYASTLQPLLNFWGIPCQSPPWGYVAAVDLTTHKVIWMHKNGTIRDQAPLPIPMPLGVPSLGGMLSTAGGVTFLGAALDDYLRAFDVTNGKKVWEVRLPAGGQATPMSYRGTDGRQYIVIVAGGHRSLGTTEGDYVIAYALPKNGE